MLGVGLTWGSNAVGGGTAVLAVVGALAALAFGWRHRDSLPSVFLTVGASALLFLIGAWVAA